MQVIESTDKRHLGEVVDIDALGAILTFSDGESMEVILCRADPDGSYVLANSNYQIRIK